MTAIPKLLTAAEAAHLLGVPEKTLLRVAEETGHLVAFGRAKRIPADELKELIEKCRSPAKAPASISDAVKAEQASMSSLTQAQPSIQRAQATFDRLKQSSRGTLPKSSATRAGVVPLRPATS
ncbi:helix-turn-helix domain-containing protein [Pararhodobacter zhoushanensis]|uniref:helix-turn-helix domain-containing protein n=1 Tax=Pararhodobacter zhoushanensis TaxID=2479545 RepID=UPI000F8D90D9|nr:helix-turn-helix domain-containing protein [Pararhodobacter zhoushanensis]